jgi:hypothetical protein
METNRACGCENVGDQKRVEHDRSWAVVIELAPRPRSGAAITSSRNGPSPVPSTAPRTPADPPPRMRALQPLWDKKILTDVVCARADPIA